MLQPRVQMSGFIPGADGAVRGAPLSVPEKHGVDILRDPILNKVSYCLHSPTLLLT